MAHRRYMYRSLYVCLLNVGTSWKKLCQCNTVSKSFQKKQRRAELNSVGNFVANAVLVESVNQFSLEEVCRTQYSLKYFSTPYLPSDPLEKPLNCKRRIDRKERYLITCNLNWLFDVIINDISVIYVTAHRCAGWLKKLDLRSGFQCQRHFVGFFNVPVQAPTRGHPFYTVIPRNRPI